MYPSISNGCLKDGGNVMLLDDDDIPGKLLHLGLRGVVLGAAEVDQVEVHAVELEGPYGYDPTTERWLSPLRLLWGLAPHQHLSPEYAKRLSEE